MASEADIAVFTAGLLSFPDFLIQVHDFKWFVHSHVLATQSSFFAKACDGPFSESNEKKITLHDDCPFMVARLLMWFYFRHYDIGDNRCFVKQPGGIKVRSPGLTELFSHGLDFAEFAELKRIDDNRTPLEAHVLLYVIADKYGVAEMMSVVREAILVQVKWASDPMKALLSLGSTILSIDEQVTDMVMQRVFECTAEKKMERYKVIRDRFESEPDSIDILHEFVVRQWTQKHEEVEAFQELKTASIDIVNRASRAIDLVDAPATARRRGTVIDHNIKVLKEELKGFSSRVKNL